jgi:uncharacterized damage-inducible protein DinB
MNDPFYIQLMLDKGKLAAEKVRTEFSNISPEQLNWKPMPSSWSIGQCLDHLIVSDSLYFPSLEKIAAGTYHMNFWEKWSPLSRYFGQTLVQQIQEQVTKKFKAPKVFTPSASQIDIGILDRFQKHLDTMLEYVAAHKRSNLDKVYITSPVSRFVTYSLRDAITILINHEYRHIHQAERVKQARNFPPR